MGRNLCSEYRCLLSFVAKEIEKLKLLRSGRREREKNSEREYCVCMLVENGQWGKIIEVMSTSK
jgi:hypothetical protein